MSEGGVWPGLYILEPSMAGYFIVHRCSNTEHGGLEGGAY